jgi:hypothetical protein
LAPEIGDSGQHGLPSRRPPPPPPPRWWRATRANVPPLRPPRRVFGRAWGVLIEELRLLRRAVFIVDSVVSFATSRCRRNYKRLITTMSAGSQVQLTEYVMKKSIMLGSSKRPETAVRYRKFSRNGAVSSRRPRFHDGSPETCTNTGLLILESTRERGGQEEARQRSRRSFTM